VPPEQPIAPDNIALVDQWNTASRRNDSIEREQIVEMLNRSAEALRHQIKRKIDFSAAR
jgi:hypothetical protein